LKSANILTKELQDERKTLESNVKTRTVDLERRLVQIRTAAEITGVINTILEPQELMDRVVNLVNDRFNLYYVGLFLLDEKNENAVLRAGTGEAGQKMVAAGHQLAVGGSSMIGWTVSNRQARIALDVGAEAVRFSNPLLPATRSELALPLVAGERALGAMTIQSFEPEAFDEDDITVLQGITDSLATALENARLFQEVGANFEEIRALHRQYLMEAWSDTARRTGEMGFTYQSDQPLLGDEGLAKIEVPIVLRQQQIGNLVLEGDRAAWTEDEKKFIEDVISETAVALENARLLEETKRRAEREQVVASIASKVRTFTEVDTVLKTAIREVSQALGASTGTIVLHSSLAEEAPEASPDLAGGENVL
jgi:GAF domain-containing protein